jgi:hypothetical protein
MSDEKYAKVLTANDTGQSGTHQAGIHIPKAQEELIKMLPQLDGRVKNPDAWLTCSDFQGRRWLLRYVYYNNRLHEPGGTRNEYRITHTTRFFKAIGAKPGDIFTLSGYAGCSVYGIDVTHPEGSPASVRSVVAAGLVRLRGWRRLH